MAILSKCDLCPMEVCVGLEFLGHLHAAHQVSNSLAIFINSLHLQRQTANQPVVALEDQENVPQDNDDGDVEEVIELPQDDDDGEVEEEIIEDGEVEEVIELPQELDEEENVNRIQEILMAGIDDESDDEIEEENVIRDQRPYTREQFLRTRAQDFKNQRETRNRDFQNWFDSYKNWYDNFQEVINRIEEPRAKRLRRDEGEK